MKTNPTIIAASELKEAKRETIALRFLRSFAAIVSSLLLAGTAAHAQVNSGSNGSDGAFNPTTNIVINMADHPTGIYHYTSVNVPTNVTVTFIPNANNTPVVWLVQGNVVINGTVDVSGKAGGGVGEGGGLGGPGGYKGGEGNHGDSSATGGQGPGGGTPDTFGSYNYGNVFLLPLLGGSGGGGRTCGPSGSGGGGAILIAASGSIVLNGGINAIGGDGGPWVQSCGQGRGGSGGAIRLVASLINGTGVVNTIGGYADAMRGGNGRVRFDCYETQFSGSVQGQFSRGFQPIIIPTPGQVSYLTVTSIGGVPIAASPTGQLSTPDTILSAQQNNPIPVVVHCSNIPLNTQITVSVKPANGAAVSATGLNNSGTLSSSTATVLITMPRGGGIIYATAATGN